MGVASSAARSSRVLLVVATLAVLACAVLFGVWLQTNVLDPPAWDPLGDYPVQRIDSRIAGEHGPSAYAPGEVQITATKCNNASRIVRVAGYSTWQRVDPPFVAIANGAGISSRIPGCTTTDYHNDIPAAVTEATERVGGRATWRLIGAETPIDIAGREVGVRHNWESQNFVLVVSRE